MECKRSSELLALSTVYIAALVSGLTEHCPIGTHKMRLRILGDATCQTCRKENEMETSETKVKSSGFPYFLRTRRIVADSRCFFDMRKSFDTNLGVLVITMDGRL